MQMENTTIKTKKLIDDLKAICSNFGLGGSPSEYKIITEVFLYKYLCDKFIYEAKKTVPSLNDEKNIEEALSNMPDDKYELLLLKLGGNTAKLKKEHYISYLFNHKDDENLRKDDGSPYSFHELFDDTLVDIANINLDVFSVKAGDDEKIKLFEPVSQYIIESNKKTKFCRAVIENLVEFNFAEVFEQKYDFFAQIFEYLVKDYNKDFGKYGEYYTPHTIADIIARIMIRDTVQNVTVYDPAAGSGTLVLALAHQIGEDKCTIYTQDISSKSNEFLRLNLILNNLVHSLPNVIHDDTLINPRHLNKKKNGLMHFDYIVSNPPFTMDFSRNRDELAGDIHKERFFAGVPKIYEKDKKKMNIYLLFIQHILFSLEYNGKAAIVVPTGFLDDNSSIPKNIRKYLVNNKMLRGVISMPQKIFATTGTFVSILFLDKGNKDGKVILMDASKFGTKEKVDGKNERTVLSIDEVNKIVDTFNAGKPIDEFCVAISYDEINENNKFSFNAGKYFDVKIEYVDITSDQFNEKMAAYSSELQQLFDDGIKLQNEIITQLKKIRYE